MEEEEDNTQKVKDTGVKAEEKLRGEERENETDSVDKEGEDKVTVEESHRQLEYSNDLYLFRLQQVAEKEELLQREM